MSSFVVYNDRTEWKNGNGQLHRVQSHGPAVEYVNSDKCYYFNGKLDRNPMQGPAVEWSNGYCEWWLNGG